MSLAALQNSDPFVFSLVLSKDAQVNRSIFYVVVLGVALILLFVVAGMSFKSVRKHKNAGVYAFLSLVALVMSGVLLPASIIQLAGAAQLPQAEDPKALLPKQQTSPKPTFSLTRPVRPL